MDSLAAVVTQLSMQVETLSKQLTQSEYLRGRQEINPILAVISERVIAVNLSMRKKAMFVITISGIVQTRISAGQRILEWIKN